MIVVHFAAETSQAERQAAINAVAGKVVGGIRLGPDGYYAVRVPHGISLDGVDRALRFSGRGLPCDRP